MAEKEKQSPIYKRPTEKQREKIKKAREMTRGGIEGRDDIFSRFSTTMRKGARDDEKMGKEMMRKIPEPVKNYEAEEGSPPMGPYKRGGAVKMKEGGSVKAKKTKARSSCDGIAKRGRTKGRMV